MKKLNLVLIFSFLVLAFCFASGVQEKSSDTLTVYAYDSFCGDWGPGEGLVKAFEEKTGIKVNLVPSGGAVEVYRKVLFEGSSCPADVVIGIPDTISVNPELFEPWTPECSADLIPYDSTTGLVPFDFGVFAFIFNSRSNFAPVPRSLGELAELPRGSVILIDPRTSSVGLGTLLWTVEALGEDGAFEWWEKMEKNTLTVADSWSSAYGLFTENEAPFVISYTTSPVYHAMYESDTSKQALEFTDGHVMTTEYLGILKSSKNMENAKLFCNFLLTDGQADIATANTMFPANTAAELPAEFETALMPRTILNSGVSPDPEKMDHYLDKWSRVMAGIK